METTINHPNILFVGLIASIFILPALVLTYVHWVRCWLYHSAIDNCSGSTWRAWLIAFILGGLSLQWLTFFIYWMPRIDQVWEACK